MINIPCKCLHIINFEKNKFNATKIAGLSLKSFVIKSVNKTIFIIITCD